MRTAHYSQKSPLLHTPGWVPPTHSETTALHWPHCLQKGSGFLALSLESYSQLPVLPSSIRLCTIYSFPCQQQPPLLPLPFTGNRLELRPLISSFINPLQYGFHLQYFIKIALGKVTNYCLSAKINDPF